ncbi:hypothetical protein EUTSA_v10028174mg [Eutrema salsugineum]|uniref:Translation elongation factor EFG/EF2 domain-containing protein n=1 Tax=Eutrema salsugineum TaxID=72664 RepID=V4L935_EUTSA|nr:hypothetical protein EUTSA_v10028174mg [Eutrema salsugineum]
MSLPVQQVSKGYRKQKALKAFEKEDPTFKAIAVPDCVQIFLSGMGDSHLDMYLKRLREDYKLHVTVVGKHRVHFKETITERAEFEYILKKKRQGTLEYARVLGYVEPLPLSSKEKFEFDSMVARKALPLRSIGAIERGFREAAKAGSLIGHPVEYLRVVLTGGASQALDCGKEALKTTAIYAFRDCYTAARPLILEPVILVELEVPTEFQGTVSGDINRRKGTIVSNVQDGKVSLIRAHVFLNCWNIDSKIE